MNKEPIGLYIFRYIMGLALLAFMAMLYWSSDLIEQNVNELKQSIHSLRNDLYDVRVEIDRARDDIVDRMHAPAGDKQLSGEKKRAQNLRAKIFLP